MLHNKLSQSGEQGQTSGEPSSKLELATVCEYPPEGRQLVAFSVKRPVDLEVTDLLEDPAVQSVINHPHNDFDASRITPCVSIVNIRDMKWALRRTNGTAEEILSSTEKVIDTFPTALEGEIGRASIMGAKLDEEGVRFAGFRLSADMYEQLWEERSAVFGDFNAHPMLNMSNMHYTPFISVFSTRDHDRATKAYRTLRDAGLTGNAVMLGGVETGTVDNRIENKDLKG